ncbi:DUF2177 family protein [Aurantiacibacter gangjinensis]|uniref:Membrane protein n=1 Tax=Aurantiacibacter gangjinensis TaxID=502682 RepID=A0A0G9MQH0_9SPHN|nr:DUF2177 family protein [Aurantiacibacter gangjinensis]APE28637.1 membrane protein [Aurantiacibacter gangjinensis]KLE32814.1 membrane protein [Aurantiacibacter gangjinensis]
MEWIIAYVVAAIAFGLLDSVYLRWAAPNLYRPVIGEIMADNFRKGAALAFYAIYIAGMVYFGVRPALESGDVLQALLNGALVGGLCYATFDLTNQAVMKVWATKVSVADIAWGAFATGVASAVAAWVTLAILA